MCDLPEDSESLAEKWTCEYCTYANYPSSLKCTMCKGQKPLTNEDIFRLNSRNRNSSPQHSLLTLSSPSKLISSTSPISSDPLLVQDATSGGGRRSISPPNLATNSSQKWHCSVCTYLNWPRAQRCTQCLSKRGEQVDLLLSDSLGKSLTFRCSPPPPIAKFASNESIDRLTAGAARLIHQPSSPVSEPEKGLKQATTTTMLKWRCFVCTYENWPKSMKCSMCGRTKDPSSMVISPTGGGNSHLQAVNREQSPTNTISEETGAGNFTTSHTTGSSNINNNLTNHNTFHSNSSSNNKQRLWNEAANNNANNNNMSNHQDSQQERRLRQLKRNADWQWLNACLGVLENNIGAVEAYLSCGGNPGRALTSAEVTLLNRSSAFDSGHTLIHLAIRFHREEMLPMLLSQISGSGPGIKRVPSYVAPDLAADIRRHFASLLRIRKGNCNCHYVNEHATFALPAEIEELPSAVQDQLYDELLDRDAQKQLENPPPALNWSLEITARLGSRLVVLWNRSAGDCLLDSAMQATWGVFDRDNILRRALADSLHQCAHLFYPRWKEYEMIQASLLHFTLEETQWEEDWSSLLSLASQPGASLEQLHIFALAHIFRRPIIVYGVKYVKSFRGEDIGFARFEGVYLPLLWEPSFCTRSPISLGYTRGHFSALVPTEPYSRLEASNDDGTEDVTFLPLMNCEMKLLPIHFLNEMEMGSEESIMRQWLDVCMTEGGLMVAQQKLNKRPLLVAQMVEEWLNHYRRMAQVFSAPYSRRPQLTGYSSDGGDTDEE